MSLDFVTHAIQTYGYLAITLSLFLGIVGIPAPEETLLFLVGSISGNHLMNLPSVLSFAISGAFLGMMVAYFIGQRFRQNRHGTKMSKFQKWIPSGNLFKKISSFRLLSGFFLPGLRQVNPYVAGKQNYSFLKFTSLSFVGSVVWNVIYVSLGYLSVSILPISPKWIAYGSMTFFSLFVMMSVLKFLFHKTKNKQPELK